MAMTFTLVTHLREQIGILIRSKIDLQKKLDAEKEQLAIEVCFDLIIIKGSLNDTKY